VKRNHVILIFLFLTLFTVHTYASVIEFLPILEKQCEPKETILTKKILIELVVINKKKHVKEKKCSNSLKIFFSKCTKSIDCEKLVVEFHEFIKKQSGTVIGE